MKLPAACSFSGCRTCMSLTARDAAGCTVSLDWHRSLWIISTQSASLSSGGTEAEIKAADTCTCTLFYLLPLPFVLVYSPLKHPAPPLYQPSIRAIRQYPDQEPPCQHLIKVDAVLDRRLNTEF